MKTLTSNYFSTTRKNEEKRLVTNFEWLFGVAPTTSMSFTGSDSIIRTFECETLIDSACNLELILPYCKVQQLNLKPKMLPSGVLETVIVATPFGGTQELTAFGEIHVKIPFSSDADGVCEYFLRGWSHVPSKSEQFLGKRAKSVESNSNQLSLSSSSASVAAIDEDYLGVDLLESRADGTDPCKKAKTSESSNGPATASSDSASSSSHEGYIAISPVLIERDNSDEFALIGLPGLLRLSLRVDARQKRLSRERKSYRM